MSGREIKVEQAYLLIYEKSPSLLDSFFDFQIVLTVQFAITDLRLGDSPDFRLQTQAEAFPNISFLISGQVLADI